MSRARDRGATARGTMSVRRLEKGVVFAADAPRVGFTKSVSGSYGHSVRAFGGVASTIDKPVMKKTAVVWPNLHLIRLFHGLSWRSARHVGPPPPTLSRAPTTTLASERTVCVAFARLKVKTPEAPPPPYRSLSPRRRQRNRAFYPPPVAHILRG